MSEARVPQVAIIDYGVGNLFSVERACAAAGLTCRVTGDPAVVRAAAGVILPGVGAFGEAMKRLTDLKLVAVLKDIAAANRPFLGICLGCQLMLTESEEFGRTEGLGLFKGTVLRFVNPHEGNRRLKVPHVGWNRIRMVKNGDCQEQTVFLESVDDGEFMYFVHSYFVVPEDQSVVYCETEYGDQRFCSALGQGNLFGSQFHPERSGPAGLEIYNNFALLLRTVE